MKLMTSITFYELELNMCLEAIVDWNNYMREICVWKLKQRKKKNRPVEHEN